MLFPCGRLPHTFTANHTPRRARTQWPLGVLIAALAMQLGIRRPFPPGKTCALYLRLTVPDLVAVSDDAHFHASRTRWSGQPRGPRRTARSRNYALSQGGQVMLDGNGYGLWSLAIINFAIFIHE